MLVVAIVAITSRGAIAQPSLDQPVVTQAQGDASLPLREALERPGDLTLRGTSLHGALFTISELWKINIVAGDLNGSVSGVFKQAPLREILDSILLSNGYGYRAIGQSLVVSSLQDIGQVNPFFVSATLRIGSADVSEVVEGARLLNTPHGQLRAIPSARSVFVLDFPDRVEMIRKFIASIDRASSMNANVPGVGLAPRQLEVAYLKCHFVPAARVAELLESVLSEDGKTSVMDKEDRLLVVDYPENLRIAEVVLQRVDRPRPQVSIKALIYDISLQDIESLGINWGSQGNWGHDSDGNATSFLSLDAVTAVPFADGATGGTFTLANISRHISIDSIAQALQSAEDSRLLADPNVTVVENEDASIESVSEIPYQELTQTSAGGQIGTTAFKEAGITLNVRPKVAVDGTIEMVVTPEFSRLTGFTPGDNQPIIDRRTASTTVRVASGQTFVIAGLRQRSDVGAFRGIPFLKDVRFVGPLFRSRETDIRESELVVFISPRIVGYADELCGRDRRVAETVTSRLGRIPQPEGRLVDECYTSVPCDETQSFEGTGEIPSREVPLLPLPEEAALRLQKDRERLASTAASPVLRRLPSVEEQAPGVTSVAKPKMARSMRVPYDSRFHAGTKASSSRPSPSDAEKSTSGRRKWLGVF